jgi:hypothetical protein
MVKNDLDRIEAAFAKRASSGQATQNGKAVSGGGESNTQPLTLAESIPRSRHPRLPAPPPCLCSS